MTYWFNVKKFAALSTTALLIACGGGGGGSTPAAGPVVSTDNFQLKTAYDNIVLETGSKAFTITGNFISNGIATPVNGNGTVTRGALQSSSWEGRFAYSKVTSTAVMGGNISPVSITSTSYVDANYNPLGSSDLEYVDVTSYNQMPVTAKVNYSANFTQANRYTTSAKTTLLGTRSTSIKLDPDTASTAILVVEVIDKDTSGLITSIGNKKYRMTPTGVLTALTETAVVYAGSTTKTLNFTY